MTTEERLPMDAGEAPRTSSFDGHWLEDLLSCVHCGFCLPVCPTYELLGEENDSPRGRIYLMRALAEQRIEATGAFDHHVGRCLGCRACETACPAGVPYGSLLERARARTAGPTARSSLLDIALGALTERRFARFAWLLARIARGSGLAALATRILPGRAGLAGGMIAVSRPEGPTVGRSPAGDGESADDRDSGPTYALLEGCVMSGLYSHVHEASRRTLARRGFREVRTSGQECCGALHAHAGRRERARRFARRNIEAFERSGADLVVVDSAGCGAALRDYPEWLRSDPDWRDRAETLAARVRDVSELLAESGIRTTGGAGRRVAYDAPCHLLHAQGIGDPPVAALSAAGYEVEPLPSWERCCGGAGLYNLFQPELSQQILERKVEEVREGGYDLLATGNPGCAMFLGAGLRRGGLRVAVVHPVELVDVADGNEPGRRE